MLIIYPIPQNYEDAETGLPFDYNGAILKLSDRPPVVEDFIRKQGTRNRMQLVIDYDEIDTVTEAYHSAEDQLIKWKNWAAQYDATLVIAAHTNRTNYDAIGYRMLSRHADVTYEPVKCRHPEMARQVYEIRDRVKKG